MAPSTATNTTMTPSTSTSSSRSSTRQSLLPLLTLLFLTLLSPTPISAQKDSCSHDGGLWGSVKNSIEPITQPVQESLTTKYNGLSEKGRFFAGACVGFGASRFAITSTVKTVRTVGVAYIAFEALEYAGVLKEARTKENKQLLAQTRDYVLRTADGIRHDIRTQLSPKKVSAKFKASMEKDKAGTVGFGTGAFLGFAL